MLYNSNTTNELTDMNVVIKLLLDWVTSSVVVGKSLVLSEGPPFPIMSAACPLPITTVRPLFSVLTTILLASMHCFDKLCRFCRFWW